MSTISVPRTLLLLMVVGIASTAAFGQVAISVSFGPPALPVYEQPVCPGDGYIWVPGYWAWDADYDDYYWVPGTWVIAPEVGYLWTPPWWGWNNGVYVFHDGWWGPTVGFYGGINYGFGYFGVGFAGGRWEGGHFFYNRSVTNINVVNIHNVYNETVNVRSESHVSFNGGPGGINARRRPEEEAAARERHIGPVAAQTQHLQAARSNPELRARANQGKPLIAASGKPAEFRGGSVIAAREAGGSYHPPASRGHAPALGGNARPPVHPSELSPIERPAAPNTGNPKLNQKYQQQQERLFNQQNQKRQQLEQRQQQEHQLMQRRSAPQEQYQRMEQQHQQQTQQLQQRQAQQQQRLSEKQRPPRGRQAPFNPEPERHLRLLASSMRPSHENPSHLSTHPLCFSW